MRKLREILRLGLVCGMTRRQIARSVSVSRPTVSYYLSRALEAGLTLDAANTLTDSDLEKLLSHKELGRPRQARTLPDWEYIHRELGKKSVTLQLLWQEHKENSPDAHQYSQFSRQGRNHQTLHQTHRSES